MSVLVLLGMTCAALVLGAAVLCRLAPQAGWAVRACTGFVVLHLLWQGLDAAGVGWRPSLLVAILGSLLLGGVVWAALASRSRGEWGGSLVDGLCIAVPSLAYAWAAVTMRAPYADFVYHWGAKARRFALVEGIDWELLASAELFHSDYPLLVSELFAVNRLVAGIESEPSLLLWSVVFFVFSLVALGDGARRELSTPTARLTVLAIGCAVAAFSIRYSLAGGPDIQLALGVILAGSLLSRPSGEVRQEGWQMGFVAAFTAASKLEGVLLAALLVGLFVLRRRDALVSEGARAASRSVVAALLPVTLVVLPWILRCLQYGLFEESNAEQFDPGRLGTVLATAWRLLWIPDWFAFPGVVLLLPWLLARRSSRWWVLPGALLLGVYLSIYLVSPHEPAMYVTSNFPRLLLHVVPVFLMGLVVAAAGSATDRIQRERPGTR